VITRNRTGVSLLKFSPDMLADTLPCKKYSISTHTPSNASNRSIGPRTEGPKHTMAASWVFPAAESEQNLCSQRAAFSHAVFPVRTDKQINTRQMFYAFRYGLWSGRGQETYIIRCLLVSSRQICSYVSVSLIIGRRLCRRLDWLSETCTRRVL